jgi:hypothetical protein
MTNAPERPANPWDDNDVIWRDMIDEIHPFSEFHRVMADQSRSHIVREVQIVVAGLPNLRPKTRSEAEDVISAADSSFDLLEATGIEVARAAWHIIDMEYPVILARVPIVDGSHPDENSFCDEHLTPAAMAALEAAWTEFYQLSHEQQPGSLMLNDVSEPHQYVEGMYRYPEIVGKCTDTAPILIDPDLILERIHII